MKKNRNIKRPRNKLQITARIAVEVRRKWEATLELTLDSNQLFRMVLLSCTHTHTHTHTHTEVLRALYSFVFQEPPAQGDLM